MKFRIVGGERSEGTYTSDETAETQASETLLAESHLSPLDRRDYQFAENTLKDGVVFKSLNKSLDVL